MLGLVGGEVKKKNQRQRKRTCQRWCVAVDMPGLGLGDVIVNLVNHQGCVLPDYTNQLPLRRVRLGLEVDVVTSSGKVGARGGRRCRWKRLRVRVAIALVTLEEVGAIGSSSSGKAGARGGRRCRWKRLRVRVTIALVTLEEVRAIGSSSSGKAGDVAGDGHRCYPYG